MTRITIVTRLRFIAALAPAIAAIACAWVAGGIYILGGATEAIYEHELEGIKAAHGMEAALYRMEWARSQPDASQIIADQRRSFAHWLALARDSAEIGDQRDLLTAIAEQAEPLFEQIKNSSARDEGVNRQARELHARLNDLAGADDTVMIALAAAQRRAANSLIVVLAVAGVAIPWLGFAALYATGGRIREALRTIRESLENLSTHPAATTSASDADFRAIDASLESMGFPKPNPMLAE